MGTVENVTAVRVAGQVLVAAVGAASLLVALIFLGAQLMAPGPADRTFVLASVVGAAGGAVLLFLHRLGLRPGPIGWAAALVSGVGGAAAGLLHGTAQTCCAFAHLAARGYPFPWLRRGASAETAGAAVAKTAGRPWHPHWDALLADVLFWAYLGVLAAVLVALVRRAVGGTTRAGGGEGVGGRP